MGGDLGLSPTLATTRRTTDARKQPFTGWGLTYHADDGLRIARWLGAGANGKLDKRLLGAALQRDPASPGLKAGFANYRYRAGFWARDLAPELGCTAPRWTPFLSGFGGIAVVMLRPDATFYTFGDGDHWDWSAPAAPLLRTRACG